MNNVFFLLCVALGFVLTGCSKTDSTPSKKAAVELNSSAPDFTLRDLAGRNISLSDYAGKVVLLEFWATWCPPCKASVPALTELNRTFEKKGLIVLAVSVETDSDAAVKAQQFSEANNVNYTVLLADASTAKTYNVISIPTSFLIGKDGRIVDIYRGYSEEFHRKLSGQIEKLL